MQCSCVLRSVGEGGEGATLPLSHFAFLYLPCKAHKQNHPWRITGEAKWGRRSSGRNQAFGKSSENVSAPSIPSLIIRLKLTGRVWFDGEGRKAQPLSKSHWSLVIQQNETAPCQEVGVLRYLCAWYQKRWTSISTSTGNNWKKKSCQKLKDKRL